MLVESLSECVREVLVRLRAEESGSERELAFAKLLEILEPHLGTSIEDFLALLAKVKQPKPPRVSRKAKSAEEIALEQEEKSRLKAEKETAKAADKAQKEAEKLARREAAAKAKAEAKERAAAEKKAKALAAAEAKLKAKAEAKDKAAAERKAKAAAAAAAKAAAKLQTDQEKQARKAAESQAKLAAADQAVCSVIDDLKALLMRFRGGNVPQDAVDVHLAKLTAFKGPQLYQIAQALNSDATLTEKSPKTKILKQISEMVRRVWKTSDNVNH